MANTVLFQVYEIFLQQDFESLEQRCASLALFEQALDECNRKRWADPDLEL
jgi:hypothetical protein